jgi:PAS domain S-box-containing protein
MPEMTGFELAQMVKQRKKTAQVPIIFLTAYYSEAEHVLEGYDSGAVDYLHKPVNPVILRSKVAVFAALHRTTRQLELANNVLVTEIKERRRIEEQLLRLNNELEDRVTERMSELQCAHAAIRENEELLRLAQEAGRVGIWTWDLKTCAETWTSAAWDIFDPLGTRDVTNRATWLSCIHVEDRERAEQAIARAKSSGRYFDELRVCCDDNTTKWVELVGAVEYESGEPIRMRGAVRDITERKELELALQDTAKRKDEFLATLAHELRNPLAPIRNSVAIMRLAGDDPAATTNAREIIERQVTNMVRLVDDLLDLSRISLGKIKLQLERLEIDNILQSAIEISYPLINNSNHRLILEAGEFGALCVRGDLVRLNQVISNLLNNAAKYTPDGGTIWLTVERDQSDILIHVKDDGIGIPPAMLPRVFEMFTQIDRSLNRAQGGLGIGLSLVRKIVEMHGGSISAVSDGDGSGSDFAVRLPLFIETSGCC